MTTKIIVTNESAVKGKYGSAGLKKINAALKKLIKADKLRGIETRVIAVDSAAAMKKVKGKAVKAASSPKQNKDAIDKVYRASLPDYLMILGAPDVIPHQDLRNPLYGGDDPDEFAYGDVPYACEAPYSQEPEKFVGPTRVVGRLPDLMGDRDPTYLLDLLAALTQWKSATAQDYADYFSVSAAVWKGSTALSLRKVFGGNDALQLSPPGGPNWTATQLAPRMHFINCHGAALDPHFYGQQGQNYPESHFAGHLAGKVTKGTVAAVECCYGAELYAPSLESNQQGAICNTYLKEGAYGYFGSTTIAYGPADGNGAADLICQYFLKRVLAGASLGRAALEARQEFASGAADLDPVDEKTLAQFCLLGDPSIHPVSVATPHIPVSTPKGTRSAAAPVDSGAVDETAGARTSRRRLLFNKGMIITATQSVANSTPAPVRKGSVATTLKKLAAELKMPAPKIMTFEVTSPIGTRSAMKLPTFAAATAKKLPATSAFHVVTSKTTSTELPAPQIKTLVAKEVDGEIVASRQFVSR